MQIKLVKNIVERFYANKRYKLYLITLASLFASLFEYCGLALIFQFIIVLTNPNSLQANFIITFFKNYFNISNFSTIGLLLGVCIALIYIFKNIYLFIFTIIQSKVFQDLSVEMTLKITNDILFGNYIKVSSIPGDKKLGMFSKINIVVWGYISQFINLINNFTIIIILLLFLFIKFTAPAIVAFCFIAVLSSIEYLILKSKSNYQKKYFGLRFDDLNKLILRIVNATKEIKINNKAGLFLLKAKEKYTAIADLNKKSAINGVFHIHFTEISVMSTFIIILCVLYCTTDFNNQTIILALGTIIAVILRITPAVNRFQSSMYGINSNENIAKELIQFDKELDNIEETYETCEKLPFEKEISLNNVFFKYPDSQFGLENINLNIKKGEFIGIVGHSGCYKTTLSLILAGLINADSGEILVDGNVIKDNDFKKWQNNIAILSQDFSLIIDNTFDNLNREIIEKLELKNFNKNPLLLSYGQKQRVALAQTIAQNKELLILDEATSSLDVLSEDKINEILLNLKGEKTIVSIAHRLQILKHCDRIIYMDKGKIIDIDTFLNLNNKYEEFKKIVELSNFKL